MVKGLSQGLSTVLQHSIGEILSMPGGFSTSSETRTSKTSAMEIAIELRES